MHIKTRTLCAKALVIFSMIAPTSAPRTASAANVSSFVAHYTTASLSAQEQTAGNLLNSDRARYNLSPLVIDPELCRIARIKSEDMRDNQYFAHTSPTYGGVHDMLRKFGYSFSSAGENIAHHATIEKAQAAFLASPGHRKNIMNAAYTKAGVGVAIDEKGYVYLTQIFVR